MLQGSLDNFTLDEVLGLLAATAKTGRLELKGNRGNGTMRVHEGMLVGATASVASDEADPEDVVFELLRFDEGTFSFAPSSSEEGEALDMAEVLAAAELRLADWREIAAVVPSLRHVVAPNANLVADEITISGEEWSTLVAIGSGSAVSAVCEQLSLGEVEGSRRVMELAERGLVCVSPPKSPSSLRRPLVEGSTTGAGTASAGGNGSDEPDSDPPVAAATGITLSAPSSPSSPSSGPEPSASRNADVATAALSTPVRGSRTAGPAPDQSSSGPRPGASTRGGQGLTSSDRRTAPAPISGRSAFVAPAASSAPTPSIGTDGTGDGSGDAAASDGTASEAASAEGTVPEGSAAANEVAPSWGTVATALAARLRPAEVITEAPDAPDPRPIEEPSTPSDRPTAERRRPLVPVVPSTMTAITTETVGDDDTTDDEDDQELTIRYLRTED
jgi:hypothetical protein